MQTAVPKNLQRPHRTQYIAESVVLLCFVTQADAPLIIG